ncbi:MAG: hypothetical protein ACREBJ_06030 [Nitrosotalea sp.]
MRADKKSIQVVFRHVKKEDGEQRVKDAFGLLFEEVYRMMNEKKQSLATK